MWWNQYEHMEAGEGSVENENVSGPASDRENPTTKRGNSWCR